MSSNTPSKSDTYEDHESFKGNNNNTETRHIHFAEDPKLFTGAENTESNENQDAATTVVISYTTTVNITPSNASVIVAGTPNTRMIVGSAPNSTMIYGSAPNPTMLANPPTGLRPYDRLNSRSFRSVSTSTPHKSKMRKNSKCYNYVVNPLLENHIHPPFLLGIDRSALFTASLCSEIINNTAPVIKGSCPNNSKSWFTKKQWLALISMVLLYFSAYATMSILAPFFPEESKKKDLSSILDGVIFSVYAFIIVFASPLVGKMIPVTDPCAIYLFGIALVGTSNIAFGMITFIEHKYTFIIVSITLRIIGAVGASCYLTVVYAIVPEVFPDDINTVNGMLETAVGVGMCMGPALGVWLYSLGGFPLPFIVVGGFMLLCIPICWMTFPDDIKSSAEETQEVRGVAAIIFKPGVMLSVCILACTSFCQALLFPTLQPHMSKLGVSIEHVGLIFLLLSAMYSLASPLVGLATDRYKCPEAFMFAGLPIMAIALFFLGHSPILPFISTTELIRQDLIAIILMGLSLAMCVVPTFAAMLQYSCDNGEPVDLATSAMCGGLWSSFYALGEMVGPLYAGFMCEYLSFATVTTMTCLLPLTLMLLLGIFMLLNCNKQCCRPCYAPISYEQFNNGENIIVVT